MNKENFNVECIRPLNTGEIEFNIGDRFKVIGSMTIELEPSDYMKVYHLENEQSICDFELDQYFKRY